MAERVGGFRPPSQERSRRTLDRIARATAALLAERGPAGVTIQEIVARADTSVGAFYSRFGSKEDAIGYVRERSWDGARKRWARFLDPERWAGVPTPALLAEVIRRFCRVFLGSGRPSRAFYLDLLARADGGELERVRRFDHEVAERMGRLLEARAAELAHPRPREAATEGFRRVISAVRDHLLFEGPVADDRALVLTLTRMYAGLLGVEGAPETYGELLSTCATERNLRRTGNPE